MTASGSNSDYSARRSKDVVRRFLQSVVVLDDVVTVGQGDAPESDSPVESVIEPEFGAHPQVTADPGNSHSDPSETPSNGQGAEVSRDDVPLVYKPLVEAFARLGLVCAVLNTTQEELQGEKDIADSGVVQGAKRADIVVLDWKIGDSYGDETLRIMRRILEDDGSTPRLRLFCIYTGEPGLPDIHEESKQTIDEFYDKYPLVADDESLRISKGPVHLCIIPKEGTKSPGTPGIAEAQLPECLVSQFASMTSGILPNVALAGLAVLRDETPRVLAKFNTSLDSAYLGHRMLLPNPVEAQGHLVEALGAELLSILEDRRPGEEGSLDAIEGWLRERIGEDSIQVDIPTGISGKTDPVEMRVELLKSGIDGVKNIKPKKSEVTNRGTGIFTKDDDSAKRSDREFASLLSLKTRYQETRPALTLGTIVREVRETGAGEYYLCLQPKCDAVRLEGPTGFPLIPLIQTQENKRFTWVVEELNGNWLYLHINPKPNRLRVPSFEPGDNPPGQVSASEREGGYFFRDTTCVEYQWVAALKDEHALKIAGEVSAQLGRPGPNDSEWLRKQSRR